MAVRKNSWTRRIGIVLLLASHVARASDYNATFCQTVVGTLNIHWQAVGGPFAPCTGIEVTNGTVAEAATGTISMAGTSVSNPSCIGTAAYTLTLSPATAALTGSDTLNNVPMVLTRGPGEACFVGHWVSGADDYVAHIWAGAFPLAAIVIPVLNDAGLSLLVGLLAIAGTVALRKRRRV